MSLRKHLLEAVTLVVAAVLCATIANAIASRERRLSLLGSYPNALRVPAASAEETPLPPVTSTTAPLTGTVAALTTSVPPAATATSVAPPATATTQTAAPTVPRTAQPAAAPRVDVSRFQPHPDKAYVEIAYDDAAALRAAGALVLDARRTSAFEQGHIAGSRPFSVWEADVDDKVNKLFEERGDPAEQNKPIVIYCSGGECEDSHMLAQKLWGIQFNNVYVYRDGYPDWVKRGGPVRTGAQP